MTFRGRHIKDTFAPKYIRVRRILIFLTIFQLSTGNLLGNELMKLPVLVRHYQLYSATCSKGGCWSDFLQLHYANTVHRGTDPVHRQLPLQSPACSSQVVMLLPAGMTSLQGSAPDADNLPGLPAFYETLLPADFVSRLLRPPCFSFGFD